MECIILDHPFAKDLISRLRNKQTSIDEFRHATQKLTTLLLIEATRNLNLEAIKIDTPLESCEGHRIKSQAVFLPILRSGIGMLSTALEFFPKAPVGVIGMVRNEETALATPYYYNVPSLHRKTVFILEPMLATGGTCRHVLDKVYRENPLQVSLLSIVASSEGLQALESFPNLKVYIAARDRTLNERKYILPGLGDFGDRFFFA